MAGFLGFGAFGRGGGGGGRGIGGGAEPGAQRGVRDVGGGEIVGVHLVFELLDGGVDEEGWVRGAGAAPDDVWGSVVVEGCCFGEYAGTFGGGDEVGGDVVEALSVWGRGALLYDELAL